MKKILTFALLAVCASQAFAGVSLLTSRAQITETDYIEWSDLGPSGTVMGSPFIINTHGTPFPALVNGVPSFERRDQGFGWAGNFTPGDALLWTRDNPGALYLTGAKTCNDIGFNIQRDSYGAFTGKIAAFDGLDALLGVLSFNGNSNGNDDGSALFVGVHSDAGDIHKLGVWMDDESDFAINRVSISCCTAVPEPASMSALGLGALALLRKKAKKA